MSAVTGSPVYNLSQQEVQKRPRNEDESKESPPKKKTGLERADEIFKTACKELHVKNKSTDREKVLCLFIEAAKLGHEQASMIIKLSGSIGPHNDEAIQYFQTSTIEKVRILGEFFIGEFFLHHKNDTKRAKEHFERGSLAGNLLCDAKLFYIYTTSLYKEENDKVCYNHLVKLADGGYPYFQTILAKALYIGSKDIEKDLENARKYAKLAVDNGELKAKGYLGIMYLLGEGGPKLIEKAIPLLEECEKSGSDFAAKHLAKFYFSGGENKKAVNTIKAKELYSKYAKLNKTWAFFNHAILCLGHSEASEELIQEGLAYLEKVKDSDNPYSLIELAFFYCEKGKYQNIKNTIVLLTGVLNKFNVDTAFIADAKFLLACIYLGDFGKDFINREAGMKLLNDTSKNTTPRAWIRLAKEYLYGIHCEKNTTEAFNATMKAKELGDPDGFFLLGKCYRNGLGVEKNLTLAFQLNIEALEKGSNKAWFFAGIDYLYGKGVTVNIGKAKNYFHKSTSFSNKALFYLGQISEYELRLLKATLSQGRVKGEREAIIEKTTEMMRYYQRAHESGNVDATFAIAIQFRRGEHTNKDIKRSIEYYTDAATKKSLTAILDLYFIYQLGIEIPQDLNKAKYWMDQYNQEEATRIVK